jgi:hypothetical protein
MRHADRNWLAAVIVMPHNTFTPDRLSLPEGASLRERAAEEIPSMSSHASLTSLVTGHHHMSIRMFCSTSTVGVLVSFGRRAAWMAAKGTPWLTTRASPAGWSHGL